MGEKIGPNPKISISNVQHRTFNVEHRTVHGLTNGRDVRATYAALLPQTARGIAQSISMLDVRCSMFDVQSLFVTPWRFAYRFLALHAYVHQLGALACMSKTTIATNEHRGIRVMAGKSIYGSGLMTESRH